MKKYTALLVAIIAIGLYNLSCAPGKKIDSNSSSLKDAYKNDFLIGTALIGRQIEEKDPGAAILVPQQFNAATPENIMKAEVIQPGWDTYNFDLADKLVAYGKKYNGR